MYPCQSLAEGRNIREGGGPDLVALGLCRPVGPYVMYQLAPGSLYPGETLPRRGVPRRADPDCSTRHVVKGMSDYAYALQHLLGPHNCPAEDIATVHSYHVEGYLAIGDVGVVYPDVVPYSASPERWSDRT